MNNHSVTIRELTLQAATVLESAGVPQARLEAMSLIGHVSGKDRTFLITHPEVTLSEQEVRTLRQMIERRASGIPLQYITGVQSFYGLELEVNPDVLIPRPETELLVERAIEILDRSVTMPLICDVGTGSGCIAIAILHERPHVRAVGIDISVPALRVASRNAARFGVDARLELIASDEFSAIDPRLTSFSMVISNPPYIAESAMPGLQREVRDHEPRAALTPGGDGLGAIRRLLKETPAFLQSGGYFLFEIGFDQDEVVHGLIDPGIWPVCEIQKDLQGIPRVVVLRKR